MIYTLSLGLLLGYEIHKMYQFKFFYKLRRISMDYYSSLLKKVNSVAYKELINLSLVDLAYLIVLVISLFTFNLYFAFTLIILSVVESFVFRITKNNFIRKSFYFINILISMSLLTLSIINAIFYKVDGLELITKLLNLL